MKVFIVCKHERFSDAAVKSSQQPATSNQHPATSTQHPAPSQVPADSGMSLLTLKPGFDQILFHFSFSVFHHNELKDIETSHHFFYP